MTQITEQEKLDLKHRLDDVISEYIKETENLNNTLYKMYRKRNEIKVICEKLGYEFSSQMEIIEEKNVSNKTQEQ